MIRSVEFENLRGVRAGKVEGLSELSILVGPNNCGKTTTLEALLLAASDTSFGETLQILLRGAGDPLLALERIVSSGAEKAHEGRRRCGGCPPY
jgi:recombinational DNA repair ATPase RecF